MRHEPGSGAKWLVLGVLAGAFSVMINVGAVIAWVSVRAGSAGRGAVVYSPSSHPTSAWQGTSSPRFEETDVTPKLPSVKRAVPVFDARLLDGCSKADLDAVETHINDAIGVGAPLYNDGDFAGCYQTYDSAAQSIERLTEKTCKGPARTLKTGRERAAKLTTPSQQAWAMRDAFDGLLDVIDRKGLEL